MNKEEQILQAIASLSDRMDQKIENLSADVDRKIESLANNMDANIESLTSNMDARFDAMERRMDSMDLRFDAMENRMDSMEQRLDAKIDYVAQELSDLTDQVKEHTTLIHALIDGQTRMQCQMEERYDQLDQKYAALSERTDDLEMIVKQQCIDITLLKQAT